MAFHIVKHGRLIRHIREESIPGKKYISLQVSAEKDFAYALTNCFSLAYLGFMRKL